MNAKPQVILSLLAVSLLCFARSVLALPSTPITNIVTNGGFETGDFTGWTVSGDSDFVNGGSGDVGVSNAAAHSGNYGAFFGTVGSLSYLSQNLSTVAGASYDLSFFLRDEVGESLNMSPIRPGGGPVVQEFQVFWNGILIFSIPPNADPSVYSQLNFTGLVATGTTTELKFGFRNDPSFWNIDDIAAGASSVPEALSTIWLALPVVGMFGLLRPRGKTA